MTKVTASEAATAPGDYVRLQEVTFLLSGVSRIGHLHNLTDIDDLDIALPATLASMLQDTGGIYWTAGIGQLSAFVRVKAGGGILQDGSGLSLNMPLLSGVFAVWGHTHFLSDIVDFAAQLPGAMAGVLTNSNTVQWTLAGGDITAAVIVKAGGGLLEDGSGLYCDFGSGINQVARGNHSHAQLHNPVTVNPSQTITVTLVDQTLGLEVTLAPSAGLKVIPTSGVGVDFGPGHNQVMRGDYVAPNDHVPVTVVNTNTLALSINGAGQVLSGVPILDPSPPGGNARLAAGPNGLMVPLGTTAGTAAEGNHVHVAATEATDGFLSAADKLRLDTLWGASGGATIVKEGIRVTLEGYGNPLTTGVKGHFVMPYSGVVRGWDIIADQTPNAQIVVDVLKAPFGSFPPSVSIAGSEKPTLNSGVQAAQDLSLSTWSANLVPNDVLAFNITSAGLWATRVMVNLRVDRI